MEHDVIVVAAAQAYFLYQAYGAYVCQSGRSFRNVPRMGFYSNHHIHPHIPLILARHDHVLFSKESAHAFRARGDGASREIAHLMERLIQDGYRDHGTIEQVFLLSSPGDERTLLLHDAVRNDSLGPKGQRIAWTRGQRYTSSAALLKGPRSTLELETLGG